MYIYSLFSKQKIGFILKGLKMRFCEQKLFQNLIMILVLLVCTQIEAMRPLKEEQWPKLISQSLNGRRCRRRGRTRVRIFPDKGMLLVNWPAWMSPALLSVSHLLCRRHHHHLRFLRCLDDQAYGNLFILVLRLFIYLFFQLIILKDYCWIHGLILNMLYFEWNLF